MKQGTKYKAGNDTVQAENSSCKGPAAALEESKSLGTKQPSEVALSCLICLSGRKILQLLFSRLRDKIEFVVTSFIFTSVSETWIVLPISNFPSLYQTLYHTSDLLL